jgi:hypothetical protein
MDANTKKLRPYQDQLVADVSRASEDVLVEQPTGSGKTVQIVVLVAMHLGPRFTHAVISAPQEQIEAGFVKRDYSVVAFPDCPGAARPAIQVPKVLIKGARESQLGSRKRVIRYLQQAGPLDHAFACTHAALNGLGPEDLPADLTGKALFIDEAHHASADSLSQIVALWRERGGQLLFFTATPYRGDDRPVRLDGMRAFRRSLAEHMDDGFAPRHLESEIVALGKPGDRVTAAQFTGQEAPPTSYFEGLAAAICRRWQEDGKPKTIVRVPPMQGGRSGELVARLKEALSSQGARVLDASGTGAADKERFLTALEAEKKRSFAASAYDVMVGIQRVLEGTDWPVCSAAYCVGMPGSLNTVVQFLGRAMRLKGGDYPASQRDRARLVFFVPCGGGAALADLSTDHSRHALLTCCFLADHEVGQEWIVLKEVRRGIESALGRPAENPAAADAENVADEPLDLEVRAEIELVLANAREEIIGSGGEPTVGEVVQLAVRTRPDLLEEAFQRVAAEVLAAEPSSGAAVREAIRAEVTRRLRIDPRVKEAMAEAFAIVLEKFREVTLRESVALESVGRQVHSVTGGQMRQFAQRLRDAASRPLTEQQILAWADTHFLRTARWPQVLSGTILEAPGEIWSNIEQALQRGLRGLPGNSSLAQLLAKSRNVPNPADRPRLTVPQILLWIDAYHNRTGEWPSPDSGLIPESQGDTWSNIHQALQKGTRGLSGHYSLPQLLAEYRGVQNVAALPPLSEAQILVWAHSHYEQAGCWPKRNSGKVRHAAGETWKRIDGSLQQGNRSLPGGSSLAQLLAQHRGVKNRMNPSVLTIDQILAWADAYYARTGQWPQHASGPIEGVPGETWAGVNHALGRGKRGFPGGFSLARLLAKHRGVRNHCDLPDLSIGQILAWADMYRERTGKWPNVTSGAIDGDVELTWRGVNTLLDQGCRGLPGNSSLAQILAEHRGIRNPKKLPRLTVEDILKWADAFRERSGRWPRPWDGSIDICPGETWARVDTALKEGLRGLPGGSTLVRLIEVNRSIAK